MVERNLSIEEAAARLGVSKFTLRSWVRQRRLAHYRLGRRVVLAEHDLDRFLETRRIEVREDR